MKVKPRHKVSRDLKKIKEKAKGSSAHGIFLGDRKYRSKLKDTILTVYLTNLIVSLFDFVTCSQQKPV